MERLLSDMQSLFNNKLLQVADEYDRVVDEKNALSFELRRLQNLIGAKTRVDGEGRPKALQLKSNGEWPSPKLLSDDTMSLEIMDERSAMTQKLSRLPRCNLEPALHRATEKPCVNTTDPASLFVELTDSDCGGKSYGVVNSIDTFQFGVTNVLSNEPGNGNLEQVYRSSFQSDETNVVDDFAHNDLAHLDEDMNGIRFHQRVASGDSPPSSHSVATTKTAVTEDVEDVRGSLLSTDGVFPKWFDPGQNGDHEIQEAFLKRSSAMIGGTRMSSVFTEEEEDHRDCCVLYPVGRLRMTWDMIAFICLLWELWLTPFDLVFLDSVDTPQAFDVMSYSITAFFAVDILLNFSTGYIIGDKTILNRRLVIKNYLAFWFWVDFVATMPWEVLLEAIGGGVFSMARMGKGAKILKSLRYLKLVRAARLMKTVRQAGMLMKHFQILAPLRMLFAPIQAAMFLACFSHIHGSIWASLQQEWVAVDSMGEAFRTYYESFWWAFTMVTLGVQYRSVDSPGVWTFEMIIAGERLLLIVFLTKRVFLAALKFLDDVQKEHAKEDVLAYLRGHKVPFPTQIQVLFSLNDTGAAQKKQQKIDELLCNELPRELVRTINEELWSKRLVSLGIIARVAEWIPEFIHEVSQGVNEEVYPSRRIILRMGEASTVAYCIITGKLFALKNPMFGQIAPFTIGMWVGENALVSTVLRCSATIVTQVITSLMSVRGEFFQQLISKFGLMEDYQTFCAAHLWKGLCGRCGQLGSHFSDTCTYTQHGGNVKGRLTQTARRLSQDGLSQYSPSGPMGRKTEGVDKSAPDNVDQVGRDLIRFLTENGLQWLRLLLRDMNVLTLDDLEKIDISELRQRRQMCCPEREMSEEDMKAIAPENIRAYRDINAMKTKRTLFHDVSRLHHLMFLSHYKLEAGTEAALMRTELENAIQEDKGSLGHSFDEPVFLDSENLNSLEDLQQRVMNTHNLVLLLTKSVLTRPWVLVEILTARRQGLRILLVNVSKPGNNFEFPDDAFYEELRCGNFLDQDAMDVLNRCGCYAEELEEALRAVFQQIAIPYSPHKAKSIRRAEIGSVLKQCKLKDQDGFKHVASKRDGSRSFTVEDVTGFQVGRGTTHINKNGRNSDRRNTAYSGESVSSDGERSWKPSRFSKEQRSSGSTRSSLEAGKFPAIGANRSSGRTSSNGATRSGDQEIRVNPAMSEV